MHVPASAVTLARAMCSLSRARATGVLSVRSETFVVRFAFADGVLRAGVSNTERALLGDVLAQQTGADPRELAAVFDQEEFQPPAGAWLVQRGLATRDAVTAALREQLRELVRVAFRWRRHHLQFDSGSAEVGVYWLRDALPTEALVLSGMRAAVAAHPRFALEPLESERLEQLTSWGQRVLAAGAIHASERALADALCQGAVGSQVAAAALRCGRGKHTLLALRAFGALVSRAEGRADYALMLRKRAQLRRRAGALELLDLAPELYTGSDAARRALRRLALHLHPDVLGAEAPAPLRALSSEVMQALTRAASSLGVPQR